MENSYQIGKYYLTNSLVHRLNPFAKILSLILMIIMLISSDYFISLIVLGLYIFVTIIWTDIELKIYLKNIYNLLWILMILGILLLIMQVNIMAVIYLIIKIIYLILYLTIITFTTPPTEIIYGIEKILKIFRKFPATKIALMITIGLRFIPVYTSSKQEIMELLKIKKINKIRKVIMLGPIWRLSINKTNNMITNMYLRLYGYNFSRVNYRLNKWKIFDTMLLILNLLILILAIFY